LVSFDIVHLVIIVTVDEALEIKNKLKGDRYLNEYSALNVDSIMELLEVCLKTSYFQFGDKFFEQKNGMAMGRVLSPVVSNIYVELFEEMAMNSAVCKPP
jgi:hypothetical protein